MENKRRKRLITLLNLLALLTILLGYKNYKGNKMNNSKSQIDLLAKYSIEIEKKRIKYMEENYNDIEEIGLYSNGLIYISKDGDKIDEYRTLKREEDILIYDQRDRSYDPNVIIIDSYKIDDSSQMEEIVDVLLEYNENNPTIVPWKRSKKSLIREWKLHNLSYKLDFSTRSKTIDSDFNNADESMKQFVKNHIK